MLLEEGRCVCNELVGMVFVREELSTGNFGQIGAAWELIDDGAGLCDGEEGVVGSPNEARGREDARVGFGEAIDVVGALFAGQLRQERLLSLRALLPGPLQLAGQRANAGFLHPAPFRDPGA